jgi:hypothetical protein
MKDNHATVARRIRFLEQELADMADIADRAERRLRRNPTDPSARRRVQAVYALANQVCMSINELRSALEGVQRAIHYVPPAAASSRYRQALG